MKTNEHEILELIQRGENLSVEFKSAKHKLCAWLITYEPAHNGLIIHPATLVNLPIEQIHSQILRLTYMLPVSFMSLAFSKLWYGFKSICSKGL